MLFLFLNDPAYGLFHQPMIRTDPGSISYRPFVYIKILKSGIDVAFVWLLAIIHRASSSIAETSDWSSERPKWFLGHMTSMYVSLRFRCSCTITRDSAGCERIYFDAESSASRNLTPRWGSRVIQSFRAVKIPKIGCPPTIR